MKDDKKWIDDEHGIPMKSVMKNLDKIIEMKGEKLVKRKGGCIHSEEELEIGRGLYCEDCVQKKIQKARADEREKCEKEAALTIQKVSEESYNKAKMECEKNMVDGKTYLEAVDEWNYWKDRVDRIMQEIEKMKKPFKHGKHKNTPRYVPCVSCECLKVLDDVKKVIEEKK